MQLTLRANEPKLADAQVRKAILGLLDVDLLAAVGAGSDNTVTLDQAQMRSPSDPGYEPTAPPAMTTQAALALLAAAGYRSKARFGVHRAPEPPGPDRPHRWAPGRRKSSAAGSARTASSCRWSSAWRPTTRPRSRSPTPPPTNCATSASPRSVVALDPVTLYRDALINNKVDAIVGWHQAGGNLATRWRRGTAVRHCRRRRYRPPPHAPPPIIRRRRRAAISRPGRRPDATTTATPPTRPARSPVRWSRRRRTSPASATAASSRRSMPRSTAPRTSTT